MFSPGFRRSVISILVVAFFAGCAAPRQETPEAPAAPVLTEVARSDRQWTGVAVSGEGRIFVNYPLWSAELPFAVGEVMPDGRVRAYPDERWNDWSPGKPPEDRFVCVQSVHVDRDDFLWVLDPANPWFRGVVENGPKLVRIDLASNEVVQVVRFGESVAPARSYLNDVRVDTEREIAYITDSGLGALVVVDLATGESRRLLEDHPSTKSEGVILTIEGREWLLPDGSGPQVHSDGIALDPEGRHVYYQALTGRSLYRIETSWLRDAAMAAPDLHAKVELVGATGAADGIAFGRDGYLYLTAIEEDAIKRVRPGGEVEVVIQDPALAWPDSFAVGPDGALYVTTSQIHRGPEPGEPYRVFRLRAGEP